MKAKARITRISSNVEDDYIQLEVEDSDSHVRFLDLKMTPEDLGNMVTGRNVEADMTLRHLDKIGKVREVKTVSVSIGDYKSWNRPDDEKLKEFLKSFEVDGWVGRIEDLKNNHNLVGENTYKVVFTRFVEKE